METIIRKILKDEKIYLCRPLPLSACRITRPYLLKKSGITDENGTVFLFAIPYYTEQCNNTHNLSVYAIPRDYHQYLSELSMRILPILQNEFPNHRFALFGDHSPIDELHAALHSGIGVLGKNRMILTERYSSFVFLAEIITDARCSCPPSVPRYCENCGNCQAACSFLRTGKGDCLSALSQKKGALSREEIQMLLAGGSVWGCDQCQLVCPYTQRALQNKTIYSEIPYFQKNCIPYLTVEQVTSMSEEEFSSRAFSWRGRETILRNLKLFENNSREDSSC